MRTALVPEVADGRDDLQGGRGPTLVVFGDYALEAHVHLDRVEADRASALASGATGTPTINGVPYRESYERDELRRALLAHGQNQ